MSITVNTNMSALSIQSNLNSATESMNTAMERMSSGYKINSASDDAAGYAVATNMSTTISSSEVASDNVDIASNLLDTAEGTLDTIDDNLERIRDLTEEASTGTYSDDDVEAIVSEIVQRISEIDRQADSADFNDVDLFGGDAADDGITIQIGTESSDTLTLSSSIFESATSSALGLFSIDQSTGALQLSVVGTDGTTTTQTVYSETGSALIVSTTQSADGTYTYDEDLLTTALTTVLSGEAYYSSEGDGNATVSTTTLTSYSASDFLNNVDDAIDNVTERETTIGAYSNRLDSISDSLDTEQTNLTSALSTIQDADVAEESATYVQAQILQSASATLLTQANSAPEIALTLIQG